MTKSALQIARAAYQPKLPKALATGAVKAVAGAATQSVADQEAIKALFPNTYGMPLITFEAGEAVALPAMNVGVILSGGQAPGGHNVISGLFDGIKKLNPENKLYGFILGPGGLVDHNYMELTADIIDEYRNTGGFDIIGSGRTKLEAESQFEKGYEIIKELGIKALVIIGGDDSNTNACVLAEYYAAKKHKNQNESRIRYLERMLKTATVVDDSSKSDEVGMDDIVEVEFEEDGEVEKYKLVTSIRGNSMENRVSIESPIGKALKGHRVGDRVLVKVNENVSYYLIIRSIDKTGDEDENIRSF